MSRQDEVDKIAKILCAIWSVEKHNTNKGGGHGLHVK